MLLNVKQEIDKARFVPYSIVEIMFYVAAK